MSRVFRRAADLPVAARAEGGWVEDNTGRRYLDAAGGAVVVGIGHGDTVVAAAMEEQARRFACVTVSASVLSDSLSLNDLAPARQ